MTCPRCDGPATTETLQQFGGVCAKCLLDFTAEKDAPAFPSLEIEKVIGEGGMGVVYKAVQKQLGRTVALKVLSPALASDPQFVERFTREAKALATLSHPNIVAVYDFGVHDGVPFLVMEFVEGIPLRKLLAARKLTPERALEVVPQICDALAYAHGRGVVHRDVKPENILIDREGRVKIADFGLAKLAEPGQTRITRTQMVMGTPNYMAPEQIENPSTVDHRADIYSLGVVFYEMLTGELPLGRFKAPSEKAPIDRRLDPVVLKSLEKEPADRWQTAGEVKERVTEIDPASLTVSSPPASLSPGRLPLATKAALLTLVLSLLLGVSHAILYFIVEGHPINGAAVSLHLGGSGALTGYRIGTFLLCLAGTILGFLALGLMIRGRSPGTAWAAGLGITLLCALFPLPMPTDMQAASAIFLPVLFIAQGAMVWLAWRSGRRLAPAPRSPRPPEEPDPESNPLARACKVLLVIALIALGVAFVLPAPIGNIAIIAAGALFLATLVLSLLTLGWILFSRGRLRGAGTAVAAIVVSLLVLATFTFFTKSTPARPTVARVLPPTAPSVAIERLGQVWPEDHELPQERSFQSRSEGAAALKEAKLPDELWAALEEARFGVVTPGETELLALRFKSPILEQKWAAERALEVGNGRWGQSWRDRDRVLFLIGKEKHAEGPATVAILARIVSGRLNDPKPLPRRTQYGTKRLIGRPDHFRIQDAWPTAKDLEGLRMEREMEGSRALYEGGLKEAMLADVEFVRRCTFLDGNLELLGIEFKTDLARIRWLAAMKWTDPQEGGRSLFLLSHAGGVESDAVARAVARVIDRKISPKAPAGLTDFRIDDAWPRAADLPEGLSLADPKEGDEAFRLSGIPAEAKADLVRIRSARVMPGNVYLLALEFKSELLRLQWEKVDPIRGVTFQLPRNVPASGGKSAFLWASDGGPKAKATHEALLPILDRKLRAAAELESQRK